MIRLIGHVLSVILLVIGSLSIKIVDTIIRFLVNMIKSVTGAKIEKDSMKFHVQREEVRPEYENKEIGDIDVKTTLSKSSYPFSPEDLIKKVKILVSPEAEFGSKNPDLLADDFQFVFPVVGPLKKMEFCTIFGSFKINEAFSESNRNYFGFTVDPMEPNRVWFFSRAEMKHTGTLKFGAKHYPPTGKEVVCTPQVLSMSFDREGRCYKFTGGYSVDRTAGNCDGLGGVFGMIHSIGGSLPFPEGKPWKPSLEWEAFAKHIPEIEKAWGTDRYKTN